jgi:site-specific DNA recombinase
VTKSRQALRSPSLSPPPASRPAIGYVRVSTDEQAQEGVSLDLQPRKIEAYCELHGLELSEIITDAGLSGKSLERRGVRRLLARIRAGGVGAVVVTKLDRLTRSPRDLYMLVDDVLHPRGVELISVQEHIDTRTPTGRAMLGLLGIFAQMERELIAERTRAALQHKKELGERLGTTPLGFVTPEAGATMVECAEELETVRLILSMREAGASFRTIASALEAAGRQTKRGGKRWHMESVRGVWDARDRYVAMSQTPEKLAA